ncbi:MAG: hypothetical protein GC159_06925 [Phycisphaera sp.]|nr:hypothetical protein [Phycisphaera sp.]
MNETVIEAIEKQLDAINAKLDRLDEAIRGTPGNGTKPGILIRLDRLEQDARRQGKLIWLIVGAAVTGLTSAIVMWITG